MFAHFQVLYTCGWGWGGEYVVHISCCFQHVSVDIKFSLTLGTLRILICNKIFLAWRYQNTMSETFHANGIRLGSNFVCMCLF